MRHLHGRIQCGFLNEQGGVADLDPEIEVGSTSHDGECILVGYQLCFDLDAADKEFFLEKPDPRGDNPTYRSRDSE